MNLFLAPQIRLSLTIAIILCLLSISGCSSRRRHSSNYSRPLTTQTMPANEQELQQECTRIRKRMAQVNYNIREANNVLSNKFMVLAAEDRARQELASLESRAAEIGCTAAFSSVRSEKKSFDECFNNCKKYTERTNEQCFDSCK